MHVPRHSGFIIKGVAQPGTCGKDRIPSGVFDVASLALYASAPNHVFGQMLGLPGSRAFATLRSALSAKVAPGELLRLCPGSSG